MLLGLTIASGPPGAWLAIGIWKYEQNELCAPITPSTSGWAGGDARAFLKHRANSKPCACWGRLVARAVADRVAARLEAAALQGEADRLDHRQRDPAPGPVQRKVGHDQDVGTRDCARDEATARRRRELLPRWRGTTVGDPHAAGGDRDVARRRQAADASRPVRARVDPVHLPGDLVRRPDGAVAERDPGHAERQRDLVQLQLRPGVDPPHAAAQRVRHPDGASAHGHPGEALRRDLDPASDPVGVGDRSQRPRESNGREKSTTQTRPAPEAIGFAPAVR